MKLIRRLEELGSEVRGGAVAIGNFDGVHRGHAYLVDRLRTMADRLGGPSIVLTFDPLPAMVLRPSQAPSPLTWIERRAELLGQLGVDYVLAYPTDQALLQLEPDAFFSEVVQSRLGARGMVEGGNFYFGRNRAGDVEMLAEFCRQAGMEIDIVQPVDHGAKIVSSSRIRALLAAGQADEANSMLTRPYRLRGMVIHGAGRGRTLGYPTANVEQTDTLLPGEGIYAGVARADDRWWPAAISIGPNPTFGEQARKIEVYLSGYCGDLYDRVLEVDVLSRLRDVVRYRTVDELKVQLAKDVADTEIAASSHLAG